MLLYVINVNLCILQKYLNVQLSTYLYHYPEGQYELWLGTDNSTRPFVDATNG
jgi:hypothetical protein